MDAVERVHAVSKPVVVSIPHQLGKQEAARRLKSGLGKVVESFGTTLLVVDQSWTDDHLDFHVRALGQTTSGTVDVAEDHVRLEVRLPWALAMLAEKAKAVIKQRGQLLLEKK